MPNQEKLEAKSEERKILVTPCCKTINWHAIVKLEDGKEMICRCELCDTELPVRLLETVIQGLNPTTYFCDKCHISADTLCKQSRS